jgi:hypothetical protein
MYKLIFLLFALTFLNSLIIVSNETYSARCRKKHPSYYTNRRCFHLKEYLNKSFIILNNKGMGNLGGLWKEKICTKRYFIQL